MSRLYKYILERWHLVPYLTINITKSKVLSFLKPYLCHFISIFSFITSFHHLSIISFIQSQTILLYILPYRSLVSIFLSNLILHYENQVFYYEHIVIF